MTFRSLFPRGFTSMTGEAIRISLFSLFGKSFGFLVPVLIAAHFGVGESTDAFFLAYVLLFFGVNLITNIFETVLVPFVAEVRHSRQDVGSFVGQILKRSTLFLVFVVIVLAFVLKAVSPFLVRASSETQGLVQRLLLEMIPVVFLTLWTSAINGTLIAYRLFDLPAFSPGIRSVVVMGVIITLGPSLGIHAIALGYVTGEVFRFLVSFTTFRKNISAIHFSGGRSVHLHPFFESAIPHAIGLVFINSLPFIDQIMAAWAGKGSVSLYAYANRLYVVPFFLMTSGWVPVVFSRWANEFNTPGGLSWQKAQKKLWGLTFLATGVAAACIVLSGWGVRLFFDRGAFPREDLDVVATLFIILTAGLPLQVMNVLCVRLLTIQKQNRFYMGVAFVRMILDIFLNLLFLQWFGIYGIALSTTLLYLFSAWTFYVYARRHFVRIVETSNKRGNLNLRNGIHPQEGME